MAGNVAEQKKLILPFLQRADEVAPVEPKIAYYCRLYAVEQGLSLENRAPQIDGVLGALLAKLEKDKPTLELGPDDRQHCENFAFSVFGRADKVDRAGRADRATAMTFYAASIFFEILNQFGQLPPETLEVQRYAAWKAADISKALREGRTPTAGAPITASDAAELDSLVATLPATPGTAQQPLGGAAPAGPPEAPAGNLPTAPVDIPPGAGEAHTGGNTLLGAHGEGASASGPAPRFKPGSKVLFCADGRSAPVRGTVAKVDRGPARVIYMVGLAQTVVSAQDDALAPDYEPGARVVFHAPGGAAVEAAVAQTDSSHWRPTYRVTCDDGSEHETSDEHLYRLQEPKSELLPDMASPPAIATPPPAPPSAPLGGAPGATPGRLHEPAPPPTAHGTAALAAGGAAPPPFAASKPPAGRAQTPQARPPPPAGGPAFQPALAQITEAQKCAKSAASSLGFEDVHTAMRLLSEALELLTQPPAR